MKVFFHKIFILIRNLAIFHFVFLIYFGLVYLALNIVFYIFEAITRTIFDYSFYKNYMIDLNSSEITLIAVPTVIFFLREFLENSRKSVMLRYFARFVRRAPFIICYFCFSKRQICSVQ